jgi:hypothetical protein
MSRGIIQILPYLFHCVLSQDPLLCSDRPQCRKHSTVGLLYIIKEIADDLQDEFFVFLGEQFQRVCVFRILRFCSVVGFDVRVWLMLWFVGCLVLESREGLGDIVKHIKMWTL